MITLLRGCFKELSTEGDKEEKALTADEDYRIICYHCGKYGHKRYECPDKDDGKPDKIKPKWQFQGICLYCNKQEHCESECFKKKVDQEREREHEQTRVTEEQNGFDFEEEHVLTAFEDFEDHGNRDDCDDCVNNETSIDSEGPCEVPN